MSRLPTGADRCVRPPDSAEGPHTSMVTTPSYLRTATRTSYRTLGGDTPPQRGVMRICGFEGVSLIDYPGRIASVIFLGGCNFRCPFCHNPDLVLRPESLPALAPEDVLHAVLRRNGLVDGVVITGGEPLLDGSALTAFLRMLREAGLAVKLDTNGYEVETLSDVLEAGLVDYVAMDVKTSPQRYAAAVGVPVDAQRILQSVALIKVSGIEHEFRTTCVPGIVEMQDVVTIGSLLGQSETYALQQFRAAPGLIAPEYAAAAPHSPDALREFAQAVRPMVASVQLRGV